MDRNTCLSVINGGGYFIPIMRFILLADSPINPPYVCQAPPTTHTRIQLAYLHSPYPLLYVYTFSWLIHIVHICCYMFSHSDGLSACSNILRSYVYTFSWLVCMLQYSPLHVFTLRWLVCMLQYTLLHVYIYS